MEEGFNFIVQRSAFILIVPPATAGGTDFLLQRRSDM
jgi:hypothetical protein